MQRREPRPSCQDCLRTGCPCLASLWDRLFGVKSHEPRRRQSVPVPVPFPVPVPDPDPEQPQPPAGCIYTALWSFEAGHPDELSFQEGDLFNVVSRSGDWWKARRIDRTGRVRDTGIVPSNYLTRADSLHQQPWFFGTMSRLEAQSHLMGPDNQDRAFLIRQSEKDDVGYVLSVKLLNQVKHYKIHQASESSFLIEPGRSFDSLLSLVEHYSATCSHSMGRLGSACRRREPVRTDLNHSTVDDWQLPKAEFTLGEQLGSGCFADVYRGRWKNLINVAVKILKNDSEVNNLEFSREVEMLKNLHHRYLISLFAICTDTRPYFIITEFMEKGSLQSFLRGPEGSLQDIMSLVDMSVQVAEAMAYLEDHNHIHRDLAARNVLVGADYICKVADFGLARVIKEPFYVTQDKKMPYKWCAPEAISHGRFSIKTDVWSYGVLLYEIFTYGGNPYPTMSHQEVYDQVMLGYRMPRPLKCPESLYQLMLQCWQAEPEGRPSFHALRDKLHSNNYEQEAAPPAGQADGHWRAAGSLTPSQSTVTEDS